jgi:ribose 5-phosphate isomerase RpiB
MKKVLIASDIDQIIRAFLITGFDGGRHLPRLEKIAILEQKKD